MKRTILIALGSLALAAAGCRSPAHALTPDDRDVYQAILSDRVTLERRIFHIEPPPPPPPGVAVPKSREVPRLRLGAFTSGLTDSLEEVLADQQRWENLSGDEMERCRVSSLLSDLKRRNSGPLRIPDLRLEGLRILWLYAPVRADELTFSLTAPGYSRFHDTAIVEIYSSWGAELVCLRKADGVWRPVAKVHTLSV